MGGQPSGWGEGGVGGVHSPFGIVWVEKGRWNGREEWEESWCVH